MAKFIEVEVVDYLPQPTFSKVILNIEDISYIENNVVRMQSFGERKRTDLVEKKRRSETYKEVQFFIPEHFELTDKSLEKLKLVLDYA